MPENTKYASSSVEAGHNALNGGEPITEPEESSKIWLRGHSYIKEDLELIIDLWSLLTRIESIQDGMTRVEALENWRALRHHLTEP